MKNHTCRRLMLCMIGLLFASVQPRAQEISAKYGKITDEEVAMTTYAPDSTATAVVLYKNGSTYYEYVNNDFRVIYDIEVRIKILKQEGAEYANVSIPYYQNDKNVGTKEIVSGIDASAYNMENGKIERVRMKKEYIFRERLDDNYMQIKFSIPAVKAGTVIEYKYKILSDFYYSLNSWSMQQDIPVMQSKYELSIPEYFKFNMDMRGGYSIHTNEKDASESLLVQYQGGQQRVQYNARQLTFIAKDLPAIKSDGYIWFPDDYKSKIDFELNGIDFPGSGYRSFTTTWEEIDKLLLENDDFGKLLKMKNPFKEEMQALLPSMENLSTNEKINALFCLLKQKVVWNESYGLFGRDIRKAVKEGKANNAVLNFIFISMLKDAGITAFPVVMSRRDRGIIPFTHPSINKINTFVVGIQNTDSTRVFLDGSVEDGFTNILPPILLVNRARIVSEERGDKWLNLAKTGNNLHKSLVKIDVQENGELKGTRNVQLSGQFAAEFRKAYKAVKDSTEFIEKTESNSNIEIISWQQKDAKSFSPQVSEEYSFTHQADVSGDYIYINPMLFKHIKENPFVQEDRKLPVEFPYSYTIRRVSEINIPENYEIDELPKSVQLTLEDNSASCRFHIRTHNNTILLNYIFTLNRELFLSTQYEQLKEFWSSIAEKNDEMVVLKKIKK